MHHLYYPRCETLNRWPSFDAHFHDGAGSVSLQLLPIKDANTSVMTSCNQYPLWWPRMQDLESLTLHWQSFPGWGRERLSTYYDHKGGQLIQNEQRRPIINIVRLNVRSLNVTMNRTTRDAKLAIGPEALAILGETRRLSSTGPVLDRCDAAGRVFGRFWNQTELFFRSKPRPLACYLDSGLILAPSGQCWYPDLTSTRSFLAGFIILQSLIFTNSELWLQLTIPVFIVSQYNIYLKDAVIDALSPPILQVAMRSLFIELLCNNADD